MRSQEGTANPFDISAEFIEKLYCNESFWDNHKHFVLLLDYDGTLSQIASHPSQAVMAPGNREALEYIIKQSNVTVGVITGRDATNARTVVNLENIIYAGNHGFEIIFPDGYKFNYDLHEDLKEAYPKMVLALQGISLNGAWVEDKTYSLTFHYRACAAEFHKEYIQRATDIIKEYGFIPKPAHMAVEARPPSEWNKGYAAEYILKHKFGEKWEDQAIVLFMGDDTTDEDVMKKLKGRSLCFRVTPDANLKTDGTFKIPDTTFVTKVLQQIQKRLSRRTPM